MTPDPRLLAEMKKKLELKLLGVSEPVLPLIEIDDRIAVEVGLRNLIENDIAQSVHR
jgi:hypothetical protein